MSTRKIVDQMPAVAGHLQVVSEISTSELQHLRQASSDHNNDFKTDLSELEGLCEEEAYYWVRDGYEHLLRASMVKSLRAAMRVNGYISELTGKEKRLLSEPASLFTMLATDLSIEVRTELNQQPTRETSHNDYRCTRRDREAKIAHIAKYFSSYSYLRPFADGSTQQNIDFVARQ